MGEIYLCGKCAKNYRKPDHKITTACLVLHLPGACCHYHETEVKPTHTKLPQSGKEKKMTADIRITNAPIPESSDILVQGGV